MAFELTPRVAQDTGGFGFQVPVFRMNQGVSAATANPMSRAAMQPMEMISEGQFGLNPNVLAMADESARAQFFAGVDELNQFVNKAAEFGIDPSKVDMSVPESFALNQEFRKRVQALQQQARGITTGAAQQALIDQQAQRELITMQRQEVIRNQKQKDLDDKYVSPFKIRETNLMSKLNQDVPKSQIPALTKNITGLINSYNSQIKKISESNETQEDKNYLIDLLSSRIGMFSPYISGEAQIYIEEPRTGGGYGGGTYLTPSQPTSLSEIPITAYKENNPQGLLLTEDKQIISEAPTIESYEEGAYYVKDGKPIPTYEGDPASIGLDIKVGVIGNGYIEVQPMSQEEYIEAMKKIIKNNTGETEQSIAARNAQIEALNKERERRRKGGTIQVKVVVPEKTAIAKVRTSPAVAPTKGQAREGAEAKRIVNPQTKGQASKKAKETARPNVDKFLE